MNYGFGSGDIPPNKLGITDPEVMRSAQQVTTDFRTGEIREGLKVVRGNFDADHFRRIHEYTMQDVYPWAGQTRQDLKDNAHQDVSRNRQSMATNEPLAFEEAGKVNTRLNAISADLQKENGLKGLDKGEFVKRLATYYDQYYQVAPFRAGNDAVLNIVTEQIGKQAGYEIQLENEPGVKLAADKTLAKDASKGDRSELENALNAVTRPAPGPEAELARRPSLRENEVPITRERHESAQTRELNQAGIFIQDHLSGRVGGKDTYDLLRQTQKEISSGQINSQNLEVARHISNSLRGQGIDPYLDRFEKATAELAELKGYYVERPTQEQSVSRTSLAPSRSEQER
ncbi:Fic family protein [Hymenobacter guriensis]|uniref:protein adenylyltransferase n=1 Tax=Hymenobacter guriensis TaxID=2793065 RepID=A0ABS0L863_9BACT|nr:Fic family protein [Hymenobacter guriensis]MBG8556302.1 Fic family protein [Hymenobacter guriensis]